MTFNDSCHWEKQPVKQLWSKYFQIFLCRLYLIVSWPANPTIIHALLSRTQWLCAVWHRSVLEPLLILLVVWPAKTTWLDVVFPLQCSTFIPQLYDASGIIKLLWLSWSSWLQLDNQRVGGLNTGFNRPNVTFALARHWTTIRSQWGC